MELNGWWRSSQDADDYDEVKWRINHHQYTEFNINNNNT